MNLVLQILQEQALAISIYAFSITIVAGIFILDRFKKNQNFKVWKKDTLTFGFFTREWGPNEDQLLQELWDKNSTLENEVKILKKRIENLSLMTILLVIVFLLAHYFSAIANKFKSIVSKDAEPQTDALTTKEPPLIEEHSEESRTEILV